MKRNTLLLVVIAIFAFLTIFNPIRSCQDRTPAIRLPAQSQDDLAELVAYGSSAWRSPADQVIRSFDTHDVVFLGEYNWIREHAALVKDLLPVLYGAGVRSLGFEFALSASQADIDGLLDAPVWDAEKARRITFAWNVIWGFQEYLDVYHAAWQLNRTLPPVRSPSGSSASGYGSAGSSSIPSGTRRTPTC